MASSAHSRTADASVVIASFSGVEALTRCLESLSHQTMQADVIVSTNLPRESTANLAAGFEHVKFIHGPVEGDVFSLRSRGVSVATGKYVLLTEDHCAFSPDWIKSFVEANLGVDVALGGPVDERHGASLYDWALYLCEYSTFMRPINDGPVGYISGVNAAYPRKALNECRPVWQSEFHEPEVNDALSAAGYSFQLVNKAWVMSRLQMSLREACAHLYIGGRRYGAHRVAGTSLGRRMQLRLFSAIVPFVLFARIVRRVATRRPGKLISLLGSVPYLACLILAWSLGETVGYWKSRLGPNTSPQAEEN